MPQKSQKNEQYNLCIICAYFIPKIEVVNYKIIFLITKQVIYDFKLLTYE